MTKTALQEILALPVSDRIRAVEEIWDSIAAEPEALPVPQSHIDELDRRLALHRNDPDRAISWEALRNRLLEGE